MRNHRVLGGVVLSLTMLVGLATRASADIIVIDPNAYPIGTDLSTMFEGLSMSTIRSGASSTYVPLHSSVIVSSTLYAGDFGSLSLGRAFYVDEWTWCTTDIASGRPSSPHCGIFQVQELRFDTPTNFVQLTAATGSDFPAFQAFNSAGVEVARCWSAPSSSCASHLAGGPGDFQLTSLTFEREQQDIARIVFGGLQGTAEITRVSYGVPEPASLALMAIGLAAATVTRRRHRETPRVP